MTREEILPIAKPILFNTDMVRAILDDRKTATRRKAEFIKGKNSNWTGYIKDGLMLYNGTNEPCIKPPRYKVGDILYIRETWAKIGWTDAWKYVYKASDKYPLGYPMVIRFRWHPSIHMPKEAARIFLRVTDVRLERLYDITEEGAVKEGLYKGWHYLPTSSIAVTAKQAFMWVWDMTIKLKDRHKYGWIANPWVWAIEFERVEVL